MKSLLILLLLFISYSIPSDDLRLIVEKQKQHEIYLSQIKTETNIPLVINNVSNKLIDESNEKYNPKHNFSTYDDFILRIYLFYNNYKMDSIRNRN